MSRPLGAGDHLFLIDGSGYIFRAYHALPPLTRKSDGLPTGAVSGFCNMLFKFLEDMKGQEKPTHLAVIFDAGKTSFRNTIYDAYKANRPEPPDDLIPQFPLVREATRAFGVPCVELAGYEADDLIAAYARAARERGARVTIVSSDKDLMQLVIDGAVELLDPVKQKRLGSAEVMEKFGVAPSRVIDVQALAGDSVDNVPGVPGIGVKTAAELINGFGDLETLLARAAEIKQPKRRESLLTHAEAARLSKRLVMLDDQAPMPEPLDDFAVMEPEARTVIAFLKAMEFTTLTRRIAAALGVEDIDAIEPAADPAAASGAISGTRPRPAAPDAPADTADTRSAMAATPEPRPGAVMDRAAWRAPIALERYETVTTEDRLAAWIARAFAQGLVAFDTETTSLDPMQAKLVGVSLALAPNEACYVPLAHGRGERLALDAAIPDQIPLDVALARLKPLLEDASVLKVAQNAKFDLQILARHGIMVAPVDDTLLLSYALDAGKNGHGMDELSEIHLGHKPIAFTSVVGTGKHQLTFDQVPVDAATRYAAEDADVTLRLHALLKPRLAAERKTAVYETLERPLIPVLAAMERAGIRVDTGVLARLSQKFGEKMAALEAEAEAQAGEHFNPGSPKQLGDILFGKLGLPGGKRTATGAWSTDAATLDDLAAQGHDLPRTILAWRQMQKLRGTYTDALPSYIHPETGRIHTCFAMAATTTGRLSSSEPNLQNIPIRTEEGRAIRTAFVPEPGNVLVSADYSQIELRLLAHIADIPALKRAFAEGLDIHAMTASEMFGVPVEGMPADVRRRAKAINFGIIYGISAFGLSAQLGIPQSEAQAYIAKYFERFPGIRAYMDRTKKQAHADGYVETLFGRRLWTPGVKAKSQGERAFAERAAINAPIQGSAADVIRRAMIRIPGALAREGLRGRMLLQVHDELVFECPESEAEALCAIVKRVMEKAAEPAVTIAVPLTVEAKPGRNWDEAH